jgi:large subunit ribosomal protein L21
MPVTANKEPKAPAKVAPKAKSAKTTKADGGSFAVIMTGGKQYKVSTGSVVKIEKMKGEFKEGDKITFDEVLLLVDGATKIGTPLVSGAKVTATLEKIGRAQKVTVIKYKQKSRYFKKNGHRQPFFQIKIDAIK